MSTEKHKPIVVRDIAELMGRYNSLLANHDRLEAENKKLRAEKAQLLLAAKNTLHDMRTFNQMPYLELRNAVKACQESEE